jgi:hypothetical protein
MRRSPTSLELALLLVAVATIGAIAWRQPGLDSPFSPLPVISAPLVPAWWIVYLFVMGGPHGSMGPYEEAQATLLVAVVLWWAVIAAVRAAWSRLRRPQPADPR